MTGLVIADDELLIRQGLQSISWIDYGIELKGLAANGIEALSLIESTFPEILLTDIRMPGMDGLKLINAAKEIVPDIKTILLTGYQDFSYAHTAIQLGSIGYILKPSDPMEIINTVLKAKYQIDEELMERRERDRIRQQIESVQNILLNSFLLDLLYGRIDAEAVISENCREFGLSFGNYIVMAVEAGFGHAEPDCHVMSRIKEEIRCISSNLNKVYVVDINPTVFCIIIEFPTPEKPAKSKVLSMATGMLNHIENQFNIYLDIGIGMSCSSAQQMNKSCNQALNCVKMRLSAGGNHVLHIDDLVSSLKVRSRQSSAAEDISGGQAGSGICGGHDENSDGAPVRNGVVKNILDYIETNYMNDISLLSVSEYVYMNHIYLSRLIKKETGENFIDILTRTRLGKACEMLRNHSLKTYEIAGRVGITDSGYFSQVFKKHFGMTPSEYRENVISAKRAKT